MELADDDVVRCIFEALDTQQLRTIALLSKEWHQSLSRLVACLSVGPHDLCVPFLRRFESCTVLVMHRLHASDLALVLPAMAALPLLDTLLIGYILQGGYCYNMMAHMATVHGIHGEASDPVLLGWGRFDGVCREPIHATTLEAARQREWQQVAPFVRNLAKCLSSGLATRLRIFRLCDITGFEYRGFHSNGKAAKFYPDDEYEYGHGELMMLSPRQHTNDALLLV